MYFSNMSWYAKFLRHEIIYSKKKKKKKTPRQRTHINNKNISRLSCPSCAIMGTWELVRNAEYVHRYTCG